MAFPYYRFYPGDYLRDTRRLTLLQHGAYHLLLHEYMSTGQPLRGDLDAMCRVCGALSGEERMAVEVVLAEFFVRDGLAWRHKRCDKELSHQDERTASARESAFQRWHTNADANAMRTHSRRNANQNQNQNQIPEPLPEPEPEPEKPKSKALRPPRPKKPGEEVAPTVETWLSYAKAYFERYGTEPVRNATVNGQLKNFVARIGATESPWVAASYLQNQSRRYVNGGHSVGLMLHDAEKLRTEWANGRVVTDAQAGRIDRGVADNPFLKILRENASGQA